MDIQLMLEIFKINNVALQITIEPMCNPIYRVHALYQGKEEGIGIGGVLKTEGENLEKALKEMRFKVFGY